MTNTKMTKAQKFEMLLNMNEVAQNEMLVEFIKHEIELLSKKSGEGKAAARKSENEGIATEIVAYLKVDTDNKMTITDMMKNIPCCADLSNQKISAIMRGLVLDGTIEKVIEKRKSYFRYAE